MELWVPVLFIITMISSGYVLVRHHKLSNSKEVESK